MAEPRSSRCTRLKLSTTTPTKRLIANTKPTSIHTIANSARGEWSLRTGAAPGAVAAMIA